MKLIESERLYLKIKERNLNFKDIKELHEHYLETLSDDDEDEFFMSSRALAEWQFDKFIVWLDERI